MTLVEMLEKNAAEIPDKIAIIFHDVQISYRELNNRVNVLAGALRDMGLKKGDRVGLMLPRIPELVITFLAVAKAQGIAAPINFEIPAEDVRGILKFISSRFLFVYKHFLEPYREAVLQAPVEHVIAVSGDEAGCLRWDDLVNNGVALNPSLKVSEDDIVYLNYTTGSTGNAKGAVATHSNVYWNTLASVDALKLTPDDVHLCMFAPFAHPHELFARPLYLGGTIVLLDKIYPKTLAETIARHKVTCMMGLTPMYENLLEVLENKHYDMSSLKIPESGGMYTRTELIRKFHQKTGVPIIPVWGSTETTGIALANRPGEVIQPGSVGKPCFSYEAKIVDENKKDLPAGKIGEMIFKGPAVVKGYYGDATNDRMCFSDGWYYSGDLGRKDFDGNFYFVERKTGMMKVAGLKVYPLEIELTLMEHPDIKEAAVIPVRDRLRGEIPKALVVPRNGRGLNEREIIGFCRNKLPNYKLPRLIEIRESLPKIGSGKINKKVLQMEGV